METAPPPRRLLIRGTNWLGDAVMTTPAILRLRAQFPEARITLACPEKLRDLWLRHPALDEVLPFQPGEGLFHLAARLRPARFDLALVLPNSPRSALEVFLARIPRRVGYARPWRNFFLTQAVAPRPGAVKMHKRSVPEIQSLVSAPAPPAAPAAAFPASAHQIHEYLHLAAALGANAEPLAPQLFVTDDETAAVRKKFGLESATGPLLGLNPGAEYGPAKRWPADRFIAAAKQIQAQTHCVWLLFGGKNDAPLAARIQSALGGGPAIVNLAGRTSLRELMALLKLCRVLLTNDTGPMHVAAALGTPVVVPFGSTSPELTGPGLPGDPRHRLLQSDAPCAPCFLRECPIDFRCMHGIAVARVAASVLSAQS
jgi:heptosyltransferase-2